MFSQEMSSNKRLEPFGAHIYILQCEAPKIAKLVYKSNNYGLWYANNYSYWGESKPTNITGGWHIVCILV